MNNVPTIHPGEVLRKQFLTPRGISRSALARAAGMSPIDVNNIVLGRRDVTVDIDARLGKPGSECTFSDAIAPGCLTTWVR